MNIIITGSLGNMSLPLTKILLTKKANVTVISSSDKRKSEILALGATPAIGSLDDEAFLTQTLQGADALYAMIPPNMTEESQTAYYERIAKHYVASVTAAGIKKVVFLSSWGADKTLGTGVILGSHFAENVLRDLTTIADVTFLRPTSIMYNLHEFSNMIRHAGFIGTNYGGDDFVSWVHPEDIAEAAAEELLKPDIQTGIHIRYVASDEMTANQSAKIIGEAIGKPDLAWKLLPKQTVIETLTGFGMSNSAATAIAEVNESVHNGALAEDYLKHKPVFGKRKLKDFAQEFAQRYQKD